MANLKFLNYVCYYISSNTVLDHNTTLTRPTTEARQLDHLVKFDQAENQFGGVASTFNCVSRTATVLLHSYNL